MWDPKYLQQIGFNSSDPAVRQSARDTLYRAEFGRPPSSTASSQQYTADPNAPINNLLGILKAGNLDKQNPPPPPPPGMENAPKFSDAGPRDIPPGGPYGRGMGQMPSYGRGMGAPPRLSLNDLMSMSAQARNRNAGPFTSATPPQRPAFTPGFGMMPPSYAGQMGTFGAPPSPGFNPLAVAAGFNPMRPGDYNQFNQALMQFRTSANPQMPSGMVGLGMAPPAMMQQLGNFLTSNSGGQQAPTPNAAQQTLMNYGNLPGAPLTSYNPEMSSGIGYNY